MATHHTTARTDSSLRLHSARLALVLATAALAAIPAGDASAAPNYTTVTPPSTLLVSRSGLDGPAGNGASRRPSISGDGRYVAFISMAKNLSSADLDAVQDIFLRDNQTGAVTLVSRANGANGAGASDKAAHPAVSDDGRYVAFESEANNLSSEDSDSAQNVYVRDLQAGTTTLVSRGSGEEGVAANGSSYRPSISDDGRYVAYETTASNLSATDGDSQRDVYRRDVTDAQTKLASRANGANGAGGDDESSQAMIAGDGQHVVFTSKANNFSSQDENLYSNVFVRDVAAGTTEFVSRAGGADGIEAHADSFSPSISDDGRYVAFASDSNNLSSADNNSYRNVFRRDLETDSLALVSRATGASGVGADGHSWNTAISGNGQHVAYDTEANNLSSSDNNAYTNVFRRDLDAKTTFLVSKTGSTGGNALSRVPVSSDTGRFVAFESDATNLSGSDYDAYTDVFRRDITGVTAPLPCDSQYGC
ncbi:MAG: hypothetical protein WD649_01455 [Thermoleophilaceae bacterium]